MDVLRAAHSMRLRKHLSINVATLLVRAAAAEVNMQTPGRPLQPVAALLPSCGASPATPGQNEQVRIALRQPPIRGRGLRILAMDGGGMKGLAMVEMLRQLERRAGRPVWTLFDVIGGTSTGALLAVALGVLRLSLDECQDIYTNLGNKVRNGRGVGQR